MENGIFEDAFPIENGDVPASYVCLPEGIYLALPKICILLVGGFNPLKKKSSSNWIISPGIGVKINNI